MYKAIIMLIRLSMIMNKGGGGNNSLRVECSFHLNELMEGAVAIEVGGPGD